MPASSKFALSSCEKGKRSGCTPKSGLCGSRISAFPCCGEVGLELELLICPIGLNISTEDELLVKELPVKKLSVSNNFELENSSRDISDVNIKELLESEKVKLFKEWLSLKGVKESEF